LLFSPARVLLATYLRPEWPRAVLLGVLLFSGIGLQLANPQIAKLFIDEAQAQKPFDRLVLIALLFIVVALLTHAAAVAETYVAENLGWRTTNALRVDLTRHVLGLDASFHAEHTPGNLIERIDGDISAIADFFARFVVHVVGNSVFLIGVLVLLLLEDWRVGGVLTLCAVAALVFMSRGGAFVTSKSRAARQSTADLSGYLEEHLGGLPDLKANGADAYVLRRLNQRLAARFQSIRASVMAGSIFNTVVGVIIVLGTGAALWLSSVLMFDGALTLGSVYVVFRYTAMLRQPLERLTRHMNSFLSAAGAASRVRELLATAPQIVNGPGAPLSGGSLSVELDHVSFAYDSKLVLRDVSCRLQAGEVLGLLGRTGSGKTTISRLLFRLHDPTLGTVRLGGTDIRCARLDELRQHVGLVTQDVELFQGTLRDNVALFDPSVPDSRLHAVFSELALDEWLSALPDGLDTQLGPGGRGLSAGESQLIAMARVFLKNPGLIVLDEASSRLDPATERLLERAVTRLLDGRTSIVIAHRLSTVERADQILILEDGHVAELGWRRDLARDAESRFAHLLRAGAQEVLA